MGAVAEDLRRLTYYSLVSKVVVELESHIGVGDKALAEFLIDLGRQSPTASDFDSKIKEKGGEIPDYLIRSLFVNIHELYPPISNSNPGFSKRVRAPDPVDGRRRNHKRGRDPDPVVGEDDGHRRNHKRNRVPDPVETNHKRATRGRDPDDEDDQGRDYKKAKVSNPPRINLMSSPQMWEANQMAAAGVLDIQQSHSSGVDGPDEEPDIVLNEEEPAFLRGRTRFSLDMSPVRILKSPQGSLARAAALQSALIKERREVHMHRQRALLDSIPRAGPWGRLHRPRPRAARQRGATHPGVAMEYVGKTDPEVLTRPVVSVWASASFPPFVVICNFQ